MWGWLSFVFSSQHHHHSSPLCPGCVLSVSGWGPWMGNRVHLSGAGSAMVLASEIQVGQGGWFFLFQFFFLILISGKGLRGSLDRPCDMFFSESWKYLVGPFTPVFCCVFCVLGCESHPWSRFPVGPERFFHHSWRDVWKGSTHFVGVQLWEYHHPRPD